MTSEAARALAERLGIRLDTSQTVQGMPADTIASQDVAQGEKIDATVVVHAVVNSGTQQLTGTGNAGGTPAAVPGVVGTDYASAMSALTGAGFTVAVGFAQQSTNNGTIVAQNPPPNAQAPQGSQISVTLSVSGEVPDTEGMLPDAATRRLESYGYRVGKTDYVAVGAGGKVVGTVPEAGTDLAPGSAVNLEVNGPPH